MMRKARVIGVLAIVVVGMLLITQNRNKNSTQLSYDNYDQSATNHNAASMPSGIVVQPVGSEDMQIPTSTSTPMVGTSSRNTTGGSLVEYNQS